MKRIQKSLFLAAIVGALASSFNLTAATGIAMTYFPIRPQGTDAAREMVGLQTHINQYDRDRFYQVFAFTAEYSQSFHAKDICECLFAGQTFGCGGPITSKSMNLPTRSGCKPGCESEFSSEFSDDRFSDDRECCQDCCIRILGSDVAGRTANDWVADYFGLPIDYSSVICFEPRIRNFIADMQAYFGFDEWVDGLYARINMPVAWTQWRLNYNEKIINPGVESLEAGYFTGNSVPRKQLLAQATDFFNGRAPNLTSTKTPNVVFEKLDCSRWIPCECGKFDEVKLADLEGIVGWNFLNHENYFLGLNGRFTAPTGNTPNGKFLFEPIVGNGAHWEVGGGLSASANVWTCHSNDAAFDVYLDANITHLFSACQRRCFDLKCAPNSRYWLALKLEPSVDPLSGENGDGTSEPSDFQFAGIYAPVANLTASRVRVSADIQADIALKLAYANGEGFSADIGYNFWMVTCDKITACNDTRLDNQNWALKGTAYTYGFSAGNFIVEPTVINTCPPTPPARIIQECAAVALAPSAICPPIIKALDSTNLDSITKGLPAILGDLTTTFTDVNDIHGDLVETSIQPKTLDRSDIRIIGTEGLSHKVFAHLDYCWVKHTDWTPIVGMGTAFEIGQGKGCAKNVDCSSTSDCSPCDRNDTQSCLRCSVSQWSIWIKGGCAFN